MLALLLSVSVQLASLQSGAAIAGTVRDGESGRPLAGATVMVDDSDRLATTAEDGRYEVSNLPSGPHRLVVRALGHASYALHAVVPRAGILEVNVVLQPLTLRLPIVEVRRDRRDAGRAIDGLRDGRLRSARAADLDRDPQLAEPDFLRAIAGGDVVAAAERPGGLHVRGGSTDQTVYTIDGVPVFNPYHTSELMGGWNTDAFDGATLATDAPGVSSLSGAVQLTSKSPGEVVSSRGGASTTHVRFAVDGPLGIGSAGFLVSGRAAWPAFLAPANDANFVRGASADWLAKVESKWGGGVIRLLATHSADQVHVSPRRPIAGAEEWTGERNQYDWSSGTAALQWNGRIGRDSLAVSSWRSTTGAGASWGTTPVLLASRRTDHGLQATWSRRSSSTTSQSGLRFEDSRISYTVTDDQHVSADLRTAAPLLTAFGDLQRAIGATVRLDLGASAMLFGGRGYLSPSVRGRWSLTDQLALSASLARRHQFAQSLRNTESAVGYVFPADLPVGAQRGVVPVAVSDERSLSVDYTPATGIRAAISGYVREMHGLALVAPVEDAPFLRGSPVSGAATARGVSAEAEVRDERYVVVARFARQRVRYSAGDARYVPEFAARALADGGVTVFPAPSLMLRLGVTAALGRSVTPATGSFEWESCNLKDRGCEFAGSPRAEPSRLASLRAPDYIRLDLGFRKQGHVRFGSRHADVALFGTFSNVFDRFNVLTYGLVNGVPQGIDMRPQSPLVIGLDWRF